VFAELKQQSVPIQAKFPKRKVFGWVWAQTRLSREERRANMEEAATMILNGSIIDGVVLTGVADLRLEV
jgi:hypothetical protein